MFKPLALCVPCVIAASGCVADDELTATEETVENLREAGFPAADIQIVDGNVYVGNDVLVTLEMSREMVGDDEGAVVELDTIQYTTRNLVSPAI